MKTPGTRSTLNARAARFAVGLYARDTLIDVARILARYHIEVMPLKGVLLRETVYEDPSERGMVDVDVGVRSRDFSMASAALVSDGYRIEAEEPGPFEISLRRRGAPIGVDLHQGLSASRRHRLTIDAMFVRGHADSDLFGIHVVVPDDYDCFAHLLAHTTLHYANDCQWHRPQDLGRFAQARDLEPGRCAAHLEQCGLARIARIGLVSIAKNDELLRVFAQEVLDTFQVDAVGSAIAAMALRVYGREHPGLLRRAVGVLLNPTLGDAAAALGSAAVRRLRARIGGLRARPPA